jgi:hypothetical protein
LRLQSFAVTSDPSPPPTLEWHRSGGRDVRRTMIPAGILVVVGGTLIGAAFVSRLGQTLGHGVALVGACMTLGGLVLAVGSAVVMIQEERYLAVRVDGILLHPSRDNETLVAWDDIAEVSANADGAVIVKRKEGSAETWSVGAEAGALADKLEDFRKKAALGILRQVR